MRAWHVVALGEPDEAMQCRTDLDPPVPSPGQVLVKVSAVALNFPDILMCRGLYQVRPPLPFTPGIEMCGEVVAVGEPPADGPTFEVGDRVIGTPATGALAEYVVLDAASEVFAAPENLTDAQASAFHIAYQTGWFALHRRANLRSGETLLVHAAAGGVGSAAVQLGKAAGAQVIAVVGGPEKTKVAADLGADMVVDRWSEDFVGAVKAATGGRGADVVFDPVGGDAFAKSTKCIAFEGRLVVIGFTSGEIPSAAANHVLIKNYSVVGLHWGLYRRYDPAAIAEAHSALTALAAEGVVAPLVSDVVQFEEAVDGLTRLAAGETTGRVVVAV
jgi:NADPH2:quinone reductase